MHERGRILNFRLGGGGSGGGDGGAQGARCLAFHDGFDAADPLAQPSRRGRPEVLRSSFITRSLVTHGHMLRFGDSRYSSSSSINST